MKKPFMIRLELGSALMACRQYTMHCTTLVSAINIEFEMYSLYLEL